MLELSGEIVKPDLVAESGLFCVGIDKVELHAELTELPRCRFPVQAMILLRFGLDADMVIPVALCAIHFNAFNLSLHEGVGMDVDFFQGG